MVCMAVYVYTIFRYCWCCLCVCDCVHLLCLLLRICHITALCLAYWMSTRNLLVIWGWCHVIVNDDIWWNDESFIPGRYHSPGTPRLILLPHSEGMASGGGVEDAPAEDWGLPLDIDNVHMLLQGWLFRARLQVRSRGQSLRPTSQVLDFFVFSLSFRHICTSLSPFKELLGR